MARLTAEERAHLRSLLIEQKNNETYEGLTWFTCTELIDSLDVAEAEVAKLSDERKGHVLVTVKDAKALLVAASLQAERPESAEQYRRIASAIAEQLPDSGGIF